MKTFLFVSRFFAVLIFSFSAFSQADETLEYNHEYSCNKERIVVGHCRRDSDMPGFTPTRPEDDYCQVYYPDRPKTGGFEAMRVVLRADIIKTLSACGAFKTQVSDEHSDSEADGTVEYYLSEGNKLRDKKDYAKAIEQYKKALALKPSLSLAQLDLGYCYYFLEQYKSALSPLQQAVKLDPKDADNQFWLGVTYYKLKQYQQAKATLQEAIQLEPTSEASHYNLGETYLYGFAQYDKAASEYHEAIRLDPKYDLAYNQLGIVYLWQGQFAEALTEFQTAYRLIGNDPAKSPQYLQNIGIAYFRLGKKAEAMKIYDQLRPQDAALAKVLLDLINSPPPSKATALVTQAIAFYKAEDYANALETCKKALLVDPRSAEALGYTALSYRGLEKWQLAADAFAKYFAVRKPYFDGILLYGSTYVELENYAKAIPLFQQALGLAVTPDEKTDAYWKLGNAFYETQDYAKAFEPYHQITLSNPQDDDALYYLGMCYLYTGKKADAQQVQKKLQPLNKISAGNLQGWIDGMK